MNQEEKRKLRKINGLCVYCGKKLDRKGSHCIDCNDLYNTWKRLGKLEKHEDGKCVNCYQVMDREGWFCKVCVKKLRDWARIRVAERRENGLCPQCGEKSEEYIYCRRCLDQLKERRAKKKIKISF